MFVQVNTPSAGLSDGSADLAVIRRPLDDPRFAGAELGTEARFAAVPSEGALARRRGLRVEDLARHTLAIDPRTGTTTPELFGAGARPRAVRETTTIDEWLTLIAAGQAVGVTAESTANQYPRPGIAYRVLRGAPPIPVRLAWWRDDPPAGLDELLALARGFWPTAEVTGRGGSPAPG